MAYILIDGYNLIGTSHQDLEKERNLLIEDLSKYSKKTGHDITVVFDGWKNGMGVETTAIIGGGRVIYSRLAENADRVIMRILSSERKAWIVVSSDREIADFAHSKGASPITSDEFQYKLISAIEDSQESLEEEPVEKDEEEDDTLPQRAKGNPWKLSKKKKIKLRALKKL
jgi:predicted RNA-binding protein with PIN domain